jgi:cytochrome P450
MLLPAFAPRQMERWEPITREICRETLDRFGHATEVDAATAYAQHIPVLVIARMLGLPEEDGDQFRLWLHELLEVGPGDPEVGRRAFFEIYAYLGEHIDRRRVDPADDLLGFLLGLELDGEPLPTEHIIGTATLLLLAGIDTTWSSIGSALWHLATHPEDRRRLVAEPELMPTAVEELLRAYSPVTMARVATEEVEVNGRTLCPGERVLLSFPAANRDPEVFPDADRVVLDRAQNRHIAFGAGIHRCAGSNLARMELRVAIEEWLRAVPEFSLEDPGAVTWAGGQVRGPRTLPVVFG